MMLTIALFRILFPTKKIALEIPTVSLLNPLSDYLPNLG